MQKRFTNSFVRREDFTASGESAVRPYELELSLFFVIVLSGVYIAYDILAIPDGGHPFGHSLGIVGTLLMVMTETLYSLRKRTSWLNWAGPVRYWLSLHIVTGIVGPFMVLMHTGLQFRDLAGVSFFLTLVVVGSGFVGRYLYTALPRTISGVTTSKQALEREITAVSHQIAQFEAQKPERVPQLVAELSQRPTGRNPLLTVLGRSYYQWRFQRRLKRELKQMDQLAAEQKQQLSQMLTRRRDLQRQTEMIDTDLETLTDPEPEQTDDREARGIPTSLDNPLDVPFPEGSVEHDFFPLTAGHDNLKCSSCHTGSTYKGTSSTCVSCHAKDEPHEGQFGPDCAACHSVTVWTAVSFDHSLMANQDCAACHAPPANHWPGACSACHTDTGNFKNASFNHATIGGTDCSACHAAPANHFAGACSACHIDTGNFKNANFNHATIGGTDCSACHSASANHYAGACSMCHQDTGNFHNASFNHAGLTDCVSCHTPPPNHFAGQCSDCHTTDTFSGASFNHTFPTNHEGANNNCETCHPGGNTSSWTCTACHSQEKMDKEHDDENGYNGNNCTQCHPDGREHEDDDDDDD